MSDPRLVLLRSELASRRAELESAVSAVPPDRRAVVPARGGWSVAMALEHLHETELGVTKLLEQLIQQAPVRQLDEPFSADAFERQVDLPVFLDRSRKIKGKQPGGSMSADEAWQALQDSRRSFLEVLDEAAGRRLEEVSHPHLVGLTLDGYGWIAFLALHEGRHAAQIQEIGASLLRS